MKKLILGPMATLSHEAFRRCVESFGGCDEYFTEMINVSSLLTKGPFEKYYLINETSPQKIVWQLTGNNEEVIPLAVKELKTLGGLGIDLNMGCSAPQIFKTGAGISWMTKPVEITKKLVRNTKDEIEKNKFDDGTSFRLSVKCRLGKDDFTDEDFFSFTDMLVENGVDLITIHPRTMKEKMRGKPKYLYAEKLCERYKKQNVKIYVNGGIKDSASKNECESLCPSVDGFMILQQAAITPWIFAQLNNLKQTIDRKQVALKFIDDVVKYQPEEFIKTRIQRFFYYYCTQFKFGHYFQTQVLNFKSVEECKNRINEYFEKQSEEQFLQIGS